MKTISKRRKLARFCWAAAVAGGIMGAAAQPLPPCPAGTHAVGAAPPQGLQWGCENAAGKAEGPWLHWYPNGQLLSEQRMKDGREHGRQRSWWPNGQLMMEGISVNGKRYKGFKYWKMDGTPTDIGIKPNVIEHKLDN